MYFRLPIVTMPWGSTRPLRCKGRMRGLRLSRGRPASSAISMVARGRFVDRRASRTALSRWLALTCSAALWLVQGSVLRAWASAMGLPPLTPDLIDHTGGDFLADAGHAIPLLFRREDHVDDRGEMFLDGVSAFPADALELRRDAAHHRGGQERGLATGVEGVAGVVLV